MPSIETVIRRFFGIDRMRMDAIGIEGRTAAGSHRLRILYAHQPCEFLSYFVNVAFGRKPREQSLGSVRPWQAHLLARKHDYDLVLVYGWNAPFVKKVFGDSYFIPQWISAKVTLEPEAVFKGNSPSRRRDIRRMGTNELSYRVTRDKADLEHFYNTMYLPAITAAHGSSAVLMPYRNVLDKAESGEAELVYISDAERPVAGSLIVYDDGQPRLLSLGVLHADRHYYRAGVGSAIYLFSFQHLLDEGYETVDIGRTRPFLRDGTLYFKRRLGMTLTTGTEHGFFMKVLNNNPGVREFLCSSPFVYAEREQLRGVAFFQTDSEAEEAAALAVPGLSQFDTIDIRGSERIGRLAS
ncbi:MAG: GNAT family N-acetyltransferase [Woeseiaceae bacterium]|nr:GNAT family N-acetyltransferase [Woeseiaceae bacterium]NIP22092.1 GNAT family N-acetyltransferase [Woeseiaceae bacterium]NIS91206.1 GNAT family N-acetyltransferase [Woeseiaceae bacterium]